MPSQLREQDYINMNINQVYTMVMNEITDVLTNGRDSKNLKPFTEEEIEIFVESYKKEISLSISHMLNDYDEEIYRLEESTVKEYLYEVIEIAYS